MLRIALLIFVISPVFTQGAMRFDGFHDPGRSAAILLIAALFFFGFKWRAK